MGVPLKLGEAGSFPCTLRLRSFRAWWSWTMLR